MERLRSNIDRVDLAILKLLGKRMSYVRSVGIYKKKHGIPILQKKREEQILSTKVALGKKLKLDPGFVRAAFKLFMAESRRSQREVQ